MYVFLFFDIFREKITAFSHFNYSFSFSERHIARLLFYCSSECHCLNVCLFSRYGKHVRMKSFLRDYMIKEDTGVLMDCRIIENGESCLALDSAAREALSLCMHDLREYMERDRPYLNPDLSLWQVSRVLKISTKTLSRACNQIEGKNFSALINVYRIESAKKLLLVKKERYLTVDAIALRCGFKSRFAFNAAFKKKEGMTSTKWLQTMKDPTTKGL